MVSGLEALPVELPDWERRLLERSLAELLAPTGKEGADAAPR